MRTEDLISRLASDTAAQRMAPARLLMLAAVLACAVAGTAMLLSIGPRPDLVAAAATWRFLMKFAVTLTLAGSALLLLRRAIYPEGLERAPLWLLLAAPALLLAAAATELALLPAAQWGRAALGSNWWFCMILVPALGILPLAIALWAIRQAAPTRPVLSGFLAGLFAGGIAASFYAAHCPDDSPLFVLAWYPIGILGLALLGAAGGRMVLRW